MFRGDWQEYNHRPGNIRPRYIRHQRVVSWLLALLIVTGIVHGELISTASATTTPCNVSGIAMYAWHHDADDIDWDFDGQWPDDEDWIAFINQGSTAVDISGWRLYTERIGHYHTFPAGTVLDPGEKIYVMSNYTGTVPDGWQDASQTNSQGWGDASAAATWLVNPTSGQFAVFYTDNSLPGNPSNFPGTNRVCSYSMKGSGLGQDDLDECQVLFLNTATGTYSIVHVCPGTDIDGDGVKDVADLCPNVAAATKNGCLPTPTQPPAPPPPACGRFAIYAGTDSGGLVRSWLSNGNGTFQTQPVTTSSLFRDNTGTEVFGFSDTEFTTYIDATGDGRVDLVHVTENNGDSIYVYSNLGNGSFATTPISTTNIQAGTDRGFAGVSSFEQGWFADTNNDGRVDYAFSGADNRVHVYLGNGNGTFATTRITSVLTDPTGHYSTSGRSFTEFFMLGDLNGDGVADLVGATGQASAHRPARLYVWRGNGDGTFQQTVYFNQLLQTSTGGSDSGGVSDEEYSQLADADGDGDLDYVHATALSGQTQILVFKNNGNGTFPVGGDGRMTAQSTSGFSVPNNNTVYFADLNINERSFFQDLNGDGAADYIWAGSTPSQSGFFVWLNNGTGSFSTSFTHSNVSNLLTGETNNITMGIGCAESRDSDGDNVPDDRDLDDDNDGISDAIENSVGGGDSDGDGIPNRLDLDSDNDGINDVIEAGGLTDANGDGKADGADANNDGIVDNPATAPRNSDNDATPDHSDLDSDNDGIFDVIEGGNAVADSNRDGVINLGDADGNDSDGDGIANSVDGLNGFGDANSPALVDSDSDGAPNYRDADDDGDGINTAVECSTGYPCPDTDDDGTPDYLDTDSDGDGISDQTEGTADSDNDGLPNRLEPNNRDTDGDGAFDHNDANDDNDAIPTRDEGGADGIVNDDDADGDGIPDHLDRSNGTGGGSGDSDGDGIPDNVECPVGNPCPDSDRDGTPDYLDLDSDNDGISDQTEGTADSDSDGLPNRLEPNNRDTDDDGNTDNTDADDDGDGINTIDEGGADGIVNNDDADGDGIPDHLDDGNGSGGGSGDSDGDGIPDNVECPSGVPCPDSDRDGTPDYQDTDSDNDGINDQTEGTADSDNDGLPNRLEPNNRDTDGDGSTDNNDANDDNDAIPTRDEGGADGIVNDDDADGDGIPDHLDDGNGSGGNPGDSDGDSIPDNVECPTGAPCPDSDRDGTPDYQDTDSDNDGVNDQTEGTTDTDGDGTPNFRDTDSDNDAIPDNVECPGQPCRDTDGDSTPDYRDSDSDNDGIADVIEGGNAAADTNRDGVISSADTNGGDSDGDGIANSVDGLNGFGDAGNPALPDTDGDGAPNYRDADDDGDGINTSVECPAGFPCPNSDYDGVAAPLATNVAFKDVLNLELPSGGYDLKVVPAAASCGAPALDLPLLTFAAQDLVEIYVVGNISNLPLTVVSTKGLFVAPTGNPATVTIAHLAPFANSIDGTSVTVRVNGANVLTNFKFGSVVKDIALPAGTYLIEILPTGTNTVAISANVTLTAGVDYTAAAIGDGGNQPLQLLPLVDNNTVISDKARVRIVHLAPFANTLAGTRVNVCIEGDGIPDYLDLDSDDDGFTDEEETNFPSDPTDPGSIPGVAISAKVLLQGALIDLDNPAVPLSVMRDSLRSRSFLPAVSPYGGGETVAVTTTTFAANGNDSVIDWVQLELRNATTPTTIVAKLAALVQADGDVIDVTGSTTLVFRGVAVGNYFVAVTHRNHLGAMTATTRSLSGTATLVDFTNTSVDFFNRVPTLNGVEQATINGKYALWTGDASSDGLVIFSGEFNDIDAIFSAVDQAPGNRLGLPSYILNGYRNEDVDLNGSTIFSAEDSDINIVFNVVDGFPRNGLGLLNYVVTEQLP